MGAEVNPRKEYLLSAHRTHTTDKLAQIIVLQSISRQSCPVKILSKFLFEDIIITLNLLTLHLFYSIFVYFSWGGECFK